MVECKVIINLTRLHPQGKGGPKGIINYWVGTSLISLADATLITCEISHYVRDNDELRPDCDANGQGMAKCDIRIVFVGTRFCTSVANGPGFER